MKNRIFIFTTAFCVFLAAYLFLSDFFSDFRQIELSDVVGTNTIEQYEDNKNMIDCIINGIKWETQEEDK